MEKEEKILFSLILVFLFIGTVGFTYGYFRAEFVSLTNKVDNHNESISLKYSDDSPLIVKNDFKPGDVIEKTITVENNGDMITSYDLVWSELDNSSKLTIKAICDSMNENDIMSGSCNNIDEEDITGYSIKSNINISPGIKHRYKVLITYKDNEVSEVKVFRGIINAKNEVINN